MSDQDVSITVQDDTEVSVSILKDAVAVIAIDVGTAEIELKALTVEGPVGPKGETGGIGPKGEAGPAGQAEPDIPNLILLFENQLI